MITIPVGFRTGATINNTYTADNLVFGIDGARDFSGTISGTTFFSSPDLSNQWVIFKGLNTENQPAAAGGFARVGFWGTKNAANPLYQQTFINLLNNTVRKDSPNKFNTPYSAITYLETTPNINIFTNFELNSGSIHLDGASCVTTTLTANSAGTGLFTYECWVMVDDLNSTQGIFSTRSTNTSSDGFDLDVLTSGSLKISWNGTDLMTSSNTISPKRWNHVAITRSGTTWDLYINGIVISGDSATSAQNLSSTNLSIGSSAQGNNKLRGYISNFRYTKGEKFYFGNFTPQNRNFTPTTGTTFLLNAFYGDMFLVDDSVNNYEIFSVGTPQTTWFNPFEVLKSGLVLHLEPSLTLSYPGTGSTWYDLSDFGNHGTLVGNATFDTDKFDFDGTNSKITFNTFSGFTTGNTFGNTYTLSAWVKLDELKTQGIIGYGNYGSSKASNALKLTSTGITNNWSDNAYSEAVTLETGSTWYNIAVTSDGVTRKIYVDGESILCPGPVTTGLTISDYTNFTIGVTNDNEWFNGKIGRVLVYNKCLTEGEVLTNYKNSVSRYQ